MQSQKFNKNVNWNVKEISFSLHENYLAAFYRIKLLRLKNTLHPVKVSSNTICHSILGETSRSSLSQMFFRISVLKNFGNFIGKHQRWSIVSIKLQAWTLLKRDSTQVFSCEICDIFKNTFFTEHLRRLLLNKPRRSLWFIVWEVMLWSFSTSLS